MNTCDVCNAKVHELRRGRCWGCYARWVEARPVGLGARCLGCGERRRRVLTNVELHGSWRTMCFNCAGQVVQMKPLPYTFDAIRAAVSRERRDSDRRIGKPDTRVYQVERRVGDRRSDRDAYAPIDDDMILEVTIESCDEFEDLTRIRELVLLDDLTDASAAAAG